MAGMTNRVTERVTRFEAGETPEQIARSMGIQPSTVAHVCGFLCSGLGLDVRFRTQMENGSRELARRICEVRGYPFENRT